MDNNELDKILKEKLKDQIQVPLEVENKIRAKVEEEKKNYQNSNNNKNKSHKYARLKAILSVAAAVVIVFAVGINLKNNNILLPGGETTTIATIKAVEATKLSNGVLDTDSEFYIYTDGNKSDEESIRKSIYVEPAIDYTIKRVSNDKYKLKFKQNIPDNTIVKLQYVKDQITQDSWAYQTSNKLSVVSTYPDNGAETVSQNTTIELKFSYADIESIKKNVSISPKVDGKWEHLGKIWRFTPKKKLTKGQKYVVKINKGIKAGDETLENDYIFNFIIDEENNISDKYEYRSVSMDGVSTYKPNEEVKIYYEYNEYVNSDIKMSKVEVKQFNTADQFIEYIETKDFSKAKSLGDYKISFSKNYLQLNKTLQTGYYVAIVKTSKGKEIFNCPIQINKLSAYAIETERDVLAWVAEGDNLAKNIKVNYLDKEEKTDNDGIAKFDDILDGSENIKYLKIGNEDQKLVVGLYNYELSNYPSAYIYTDRPLYKNTDTINVWGFIPRQLFYDKIEDEFYVELNKEGKQKVTVDENGVFTYKIELKNHMDTEEDYSHISLYYKNTSIANRQLTIQNYELKNYTYEIMMNKDYAYVGDKFEFDVKVSHITGLMVPNKSVVVDYEGKKYRATTNKNGIAHFSFKVKKEKYDRYLAYQSVAVYNGDVEEYVDTESEDYFTICALSRDVDTQTETKDKKCKITLNKLIKDKDVMTGEDRTKLYDGKYDTNIKIKIVEETRERKIAEYRYNEYTKEKEPVYEYEDKDSKTLYSEELKTNNGTAEFDTTKVQYKKDTEDITYNYQIEFEYKDRQGRKIEEIEYIYIGQEHENRTLGYSYFSDIIWDGYFSEAINTEAYYIYRYFLKNETYKFSIGDTANFTLAESTENGIKDINNDGKLLKIVLKEDITTTGITTNNDIKHTFTDKDFPGCKMTSAYFANGKFYRMPVYYFDFKEEDRKVDIEITADKEQYKPGDKVTLTVKTTNKNKPIKTTVNVSVVNKAIFELREDETNILERIYEDRLYPVYNYSTYNDYLQGTMGGAGGGDGQLRGKFGDTACFETVNTDAKGIATVTFTLPDNVTTYTVTAHSANKDLYVGVGKKDIVSKLDFFVQFTEPRNIKTTDDVVLNATSVAEQNYKVDYEFTIKELNKTLKTTANTNSIATVNFGKLKYGTYTVTIKGKHDNLNDGVEYKFNVVESTQEVKDKKTLSINNNAEIKPSKNPIVLEVYNKNMEQYLKYIEFIESTNTDRLDTKIAYNKVQEIKNKYYNEKNTINYIDIEKYQGDNYLKNLENGKEDIVLSALTSYYAIDYFNRDKLTEKEQLSKDANIFEYYLLAAANKESVLLDLLYLKDEKDISNYDKLLVTLSLEFTGDFQNAKELYKQINLTDKEKKEYKSIIAIIDTFINKKDAAKKINELIKKNPSDEYLRFAILSFFENNSEDISKNEDVKIVSKNLNETLTVNGMEVKTYTINNEDLDTIKFETESNDLMVSYYYQTSLDNIENKNISKDMKIKLNGTLKKGNNVTLEVTCNSTFEGVLRIALPNSLRLAEGKYDYNKYYLVNNRIDYITMYKTKKCKKLYIPLIVAYEGKYKFENIVSNVDGKYHISNSLDLKISK